MVDKLIIKHFQDMFSEPNENLGKIEDADCTADSPGCRGSRDHLFLYLKVENSEIADIKFECAICDPAMFVAGNIICDLVRGMRLDKALDIKEQDMAEALGGYSEEAMDHFSHALKVLGKAIAECKQSRAVK